MRITVQRDDILGPLAAVANVVERRQTLPILSNALLKTVDGRLMIIGTDLEVEVVVHTQTGRDKFEATLPARKLFDICRAIPPDNPITLETNGDKVMIKAGKSRFSLLSLPVTDFPSVTTTDLKQALTIDQGGLKQLLDRTMFCMAQQDVRYYLNGLYLEFMSGKVRAVATDGHRMAISEMCIEGSPNTDIQLIVPRKGAQEIARLLNGSEGAAARIWLGANQLRVELESVIFTSKLIDGRFPDYTKVIPSALTKTVVLPRQLFREALARVAILSNEKYRGVRLSLQNGRVSVSAHNPEQEEATEELDAEYRGEEMEIGFNVNYLMEAVGAITEDDVIIGLNDPSSSCAIYTPTTQTTKYIIMPMRL